MQFLLKDHENALPVQLQAFSELADVAQEVSAMVDTSFQETLRRIVSHCVQDDQAAEQALTDGAFLLNDHTVVLRLNPETDFVEFFCDIGLPDPHALETTYRAALEANLCRSYPGITLGIHPQSGRLVATLAMNGLMTDNEAFCMTILENLTRCARHIRESGEFVLQD